MFGGGDYRSRNAHSRFDPVILRIKTDLSPIRHHSLGNRANRIDLGNFSREGQTVNGIKSQGNQLASLDFGDIDFVQRDPGDLAVRDQGRHDSAGRNRVRGRNAYA